MELAALVELCTLNTLTQAIFFRTLKNNVINDV